MPRTAPPDRAAGAALARLRIAGLQPVARPAKDVYDGLFAVGATEVNLADYVPPMLRDFQREPGDDNLRMVITRRSTFELVLRERALARQGVRLTTGATVRGLITASDDPLRVVGVRLSDGQTRTADIVVDATGRRSNVDEWLTEAGLPVPTVTSESCKIVYYTRYYRMLSDTPPGPLNRGFGSGGLWTATPPCCSSATTARSPSRWACCRATTS